MFKVIVLLSFLALCLADVIVNTENGAVEGFRDDEKGYVTFYGIPYAGNVSGKNRFRAAPPPPRLPDGFKANDKSVVCAHPTPDGIKGRENCLTLDVFTKNVTGAKPVFVWLNGGYSETINKKFSYTSLAAEAVVVTVNYRLSIFGFLCLGVKEAPGNAGLKDVIQALKWVNKNIKNFGGDQNNVILLGHGGGAAIVDLITMSPQSESLVHKAIALSGSAIAPWAVEFHPISYAMTVGSANNYTGNKLKELANHLVNTDIIQLGGTINKFKFKNNSVLFAPCIENKELENSFLTEAPISILKSGNVRKIPYIASFSGKEGTMRLEEGTKDHWIGLLSKRFVDFLPVDLEFKNETAKNKTAEEIKHFYFNEDTDDARMAGFITYEGDSLITVPVLRGVRNRAGNDKESNVYLLYFNFVEQDSVEKGTGHGEILDYILDGKPVNSKPKHSLINRFIKFAKTGIPIASRGSIGDVYWGQVEPDTVNFLLVSGRGSTFNQVSVTNPRSETMAFWDKLSYAAPAAQWPNTGAAYSFRSSTGLKAILIALSLTAFWYIY